MSNPVNLYITRTGDNFKVGTCGNPTAHLGLMKQNDPAMETVRVYQFSDSQSADFVRKQGGELERIMRQWLSSDKGDIVSIDDVCRLMGGKRMKSFESS